MASWLADVLLHDLDEELSGMTGYYVRYSDDMLFIGKDYGKAMQVLEQKLGEKSMKLNPKKVEYLMSDAGSSFSGSASRGT